jgi:hypothetical protein
MRGFAGDPDVLLDLGEDAVVPLLLDQPEQALVRRSPGGARRRSVDVRVVHEARSINPAAHH